MITSTSSGEAVFNYNFFILYLFVFVLFLISINFIVIFLSLIHSEVCYTVSCIYIVLYSKLYRTVVQVLYLHNPFLKVRNEVPLDPTSSHC